MRGIGTKGVGSKLRISGWVVTIVGLAIFYGTIFFAFLVGFSPPVGLSRAGLILPAVGCWWLMAALLWPRGRGARVAVEVTLGILCLPPGLVALAETYAGHTENMALFWLLIAIFLLAGAIALLVLSSRVRHATRRLRH